MSSREQDGAASGQGAPGYRSRRSIFTRYVAPRSGRPGLAGAFVMGFVGGIVFYSCCSCPPPG